MPSRTLVRSTRPGSRRIALLVTLLVGAVLAPATMGQAAPPHDPPGKPEFRAVIRTTSFGVPHVKANDYVGVGYGVGYAFAEGHACTMADHWVRLSAERSAHFGPGGGNLASDLFWQLLIDDDFAGQALQSTDLASGVLPEVREIVRGYVAGYNRYLEEVGFDIPDPRCDDATWVRPITERDVYHQVLYWDLQSFITGEFGSLAAATPPGTTATATAALASDADAPDPSAELRASNMVGIGSDATVSGNGMLFANPHWTWSGPTNFFEAHLTIPGELDVSGMLPHGLPLIGIGHNATVGWSHTVSTSTRSARYRLDLSEDSPTTYVVDGVEHEMEPTTVTVGVRTGDGTIQQVSHTYYETAFGFVSVAGSRPWTEDHAFTFKPASINMAGANGWLLYATAETVEDIHAASSATLGAQWINTLAADAQGGTYYAMPNAVPYLTDEQLSDCPVGGGVLDGSRFECDFVDDPAAVHPGTRPASHMPYLFRSDYVQQSNNSHWLTNANAPLEGYSSLYGPERTQQNQRTRHGVTLAQERLAGADGLDGDRFTFDQFQHLTFDGINYTGRLWQDELVAFCEDLAATDPGAPAQLDEACDVLAAWGASDELDDPGAVLARRYLQRSGQGSARFTIPFNADDPVNTPRGLTTDATARNALYGAVGDLANNGIPLNQTLRDYQFRNVAGERIPVPGGPGIYKALNISGGLPNGWQVNSGTGFVMWVEFTDDGPVGQQILIQGQSSNPTSPHFADQTRLIAKGEYKDILFTDEQIESDPNLRVQVLRTPPPGCDRANPNARPCR